MSKFRWVCVFLLGLMISSSGMNYIDNPNNSFFVGVLIVYSGFFIFGVAMVQLIKRGDW